MSTYFCATPKSKNAYFYDANLILRGVYLEPQGSPYMALYSCPTKTGNFWVAWENLSTNAETLLRLIDANTFAVLQTCHLPFVIGIRSGKHIFHELPNGHLLVTVRGGSQILKEVNPADATTIRTFSISVDPPDFFISPDGTKICYAKGNILKQYDIVGDAPLSDIKDFGFPILWPIWLTDDSFIVWKSGTFSTGNNDFLRIDNAGNLLNTYTGYTFNPGSFSGQAGARAVTASVTKNRLWIHGSADFGATSFGSMGDCFSVIIFKLDDSTLLETIPLGPFGTTFPVSDVTDSLVHAPEQDILNVTADCAAGNLIITGDNLPVPFSATITLDNNPVTYSVVSSTSTQAVVKINGFAPGDYGVTLG